MNKYFALYENFYRLPKRIQRYYILSMLWWCIKAFFKTFKK